MQNVECELETSERVGGRVDAFTSGADRPVRRSEVDWRQKLARVVSIEIVPRLMMMQNGCPTGQQRTAGPASPDNLPEFTRCLLAREIAESQAFLETLERQGVEPEAILLDFFAPAARKLGELWTEDQCDFIQVSIGLHRLQSFMDDMCSPLDGGRDCSSDAPRILLLPAPGETHEFGVAMVGNFFRADGWRVTASSPSSLLHQIHAKAYEVVGVSLSCVRHHEKLQDVLGEARRISRNKAVKIILGGPVFTENPSLALELGADGTAPDAQGAVQLARSLLDAKIVCESARTNKVSI